jgi:uridine kinase
MEIAFVGIYGKKASGKSFLFDKILNLAGVEGSHVTFF